MPDDIAALERAVTDAQTALADAQRARQEARDAVMAAHEERHHALITALDNPADEQARTDLQAANKAVTTALNAYSNT